MKSHDSIWMHLTSYSIVISFTSVCSMTVTFHVEWPRTRTLLEKAKRYGMLHRAAARSNLRIMFNIWDVSNFFGTRQLSSTETFKSNLSSRRTYLLCSNIIMIGGSHGAGHLRPFRRGPSNPRRRHYWDWQPYTRESGRGRVRRESWVVGARAS